MNKDRIIGGLIVLIGLLFIGAGTNFDRIVLGSGNYGEDPNTTADITLQNDEYISNSVNGRIDFGAANLLTTGTIGAGAATFTSLGAFTLTGALDADSNDITYVDSLRFANGEFINNSVNGRLDFGAANLLTTGTFGAGAATLTSISAHTIVGSITQTDSATSLIMKASDGIKWRLKVDTEGVLSADSTGLN